EMLRLIREEEPEKPSTRLSHAGDSQTAIAAQRRSEPASLSKIVRGDLDWIALKCLEKDRTRRYQSANDLARDIERFLNDEPVEACPPSAAYKLRKFARKNRRLLGTLVAFAALLVIGTIVSIALAIRAGHERDRAVAAELQADAESQKSKDA